MSWERLGVFLEGVAAATELYSKAAKNGYFVEAVCLSANIIDAKLRIGIILARQIKRGDRSLDMEFLFQGPNGPKKFERDIYATARKEGVITSELEASLSRIYDNRNRVVHRYIISDITTDEILRIAIDYEKAMEEVRSAIWHIEQRQIDLGVGMTVEGPDFEKSEMRMWFREIASKKHGAQWLSDEIDRK